jgi:hypothetical protein
VSSLCYLAAKQSVSNLFYVSLETVVLLLGTLFETFTRDFYWVEGKDSKHIIC